MLHPEAEGLLAALAAAGLPPFEHMSVPQARAAAQGFLQLQPPAEEVDRVMDTVAPGPAGDIPVRVYVPKGIGPLPVLVYFHGGVG